MSDSIKQIREAIEGRMIALPDGFIKLENKFDLEKNNFNNESKRFGVIAKDGDNAHAIMRYLTVSRVFEITLANKFVSTFNGDDNQQAVGDILESYMEDVILDLTLSKLGLPALVLDIQYSSNDEIDHETIENLAILKFNINIEYRKQITNC